MVNCRSVHSCGFLAGIWEIYRPRKQIVQVAAILIVNVLWHFGKNVPQIFIGPKLISLRRFDDAVYQGTCFRSLDGIHEMPIGTTYTEGTDCPLRGKVVDGNFAILQICFQILFLIEAVANCSSCFLHGDGFRLDRF